MNKHKNQQGMYLIELLISLSITIVITGALIAGVYTIISVSGRGNDKIEALHDVQNAAYWINNDVQMAREANLVSADNITLSWDDGLENPHSSSFSLRGSQLIRNYDDVITPIAWNISSIEFSMNYDVIEYTITSTPPGRWNVSETMSGQVTMRAVQ